MNAEERQAMREKHRICVEKEWHCDVIKLLDAWEAQNAIIQDLCTSKKLYDDDYVREHIEEITK